MLSVVLSVVLSVLLAAVVSILALFLTPLRKLLFGPVLRVVAWRIITTETGFTHQVVITSTGIWSSVEAKNCRAKLAVWFILQSDVCDDETLLKPINFRNTPSVQAHALHWSRGNGPEVIDINPSDIETIDLFHILTDPDGHNNALIIPSAQQYPQTGQKDLVHLKPGNYTFRVVVSGANAIAGSCDLEFRTPVGRERGHPWAMFCIRRNRIRFFRLGSTALLPGSFDLRKNRG